MPSHITPAPRPPEARELILDLFATRGAKIHSLATLCRAGAALGLRDIAIRAALARLTREALLVSAGRGRYASPPQPDPLRARIAGWRGVLSRRTRAWSGAWSLAITGAQERRDRTQWRRVQRALALEGFRQPRPDTFVRPDNLCGGTTGIRERLRELGAPASLLVGRLSELDPDQGSEWRALWNAPQLSRYYANLTRRIAASTRRVRGRSDARAAAQSLLLGREAVRAILRDPLLPPELAPDAALRALITAMRAYDDVGKAVWQAYLAAED